MANKKEKEKKMNDEEYFNDELRGAFIQIEEVVENAETLEELDNAKKAFRNQIVAVEAYFIQIENEIKGK